MGVALITPFKSDFSVDYQALERLVEFQVTAGADFLAVLCTTAETPTLTLEERQKVRMVVTEVVRGRVPIVLGCGGNNTMAIVEELKTGDWTGVDAVLSVFLITTSLLRKVSTIISWQLPTRVLCLLFYIMYLGA